MPPSLANRLLFHATPPPPLLSSKNVPPELTPELYDFIALALRAFVSPWWSKITRYDKDFLPHITRILVVVIHALDLRIQALDLPAAVFHDVPVIVTQHYRDYRNAANKTSTAYATGGAASLPTLFAHLQPHMAISPEGVLDPEYYRQIVDHILKACLPPEDYEPETERIIIREIIVKILLEDIIPKISQPWFIHKVILDLMGPPDEPIFNSQPTVSSPSTSAFSFQNLIVIVLSVLQTFSGMCLALIHAYKQAITTIKLVQQSPPRSPQPPFKPMPTSAYIPPDVLPPISRPSKIKHTHSLSTTPSTSSSISSKPAPSTYSTAVANPLLTSDYPLPPQPVPYPPTSSQLPQQHFNYINPPLALLSELICAPDRFAATVLLTTLSMAATCMTAFLDKLLPHMLYTTLSPNFVLNIVRTAKKTLFPNGYPGPPPIEPSPEEQAEMRARLLAWRGKGGAAHLVPLVLGPDPSQTIANMLDPLSHAQCNRHLVVFILDRVLVGLFPELGGAPGPAL